MIDPINQSMGPVFETGVMSQVQQGQPAVAMGEADEFAVAWYSHANPSRIYLRQYDIVEE